MITFHETGEFQASHPSRKIVKRRSFGFAQDGEGGHPELFLLLECAAWTGRSTRQPAGGRRYIFGIGAPCLAPAVTRVTARRLCEDENSLGFGDESL